MENNIILDGSTVFDPGLVKITGLSVPHPVPYLFHSQKFWEFIYVDSGFALLGGSGNSVLLSAGDFAVIAPGETHSLIGSGDTELYCLLFMESELGNMKDEIFSLPGFLELSLRVKAQRDAKAKPKSSKYECIRFDFSERHEFMRLCDRINRERITKIRGWQQIIKGLLCETLVFYSRLDVAAKRAERLSDSPGGMSYKIIKYLEENYGKNVTGADLAKETGLSADYLIKHFKAELSLSPAEYLRRYRIAKSMELLRSTELAVNEIAQRCGFVDMSAFSRVFKAYEGDTPSGYRKKFRR